MQYRHHLTSPGLFSRCCFLAVLLSGPAFAVEPAALADCARIADSKQRLECYDRLAERPADVPATSLDSSATSLDASATPETIAPPPPEAIEAAKIVENEPFSLAKHWELDAAHKRGAFVFQPHNQNYLLLANHSRDPNAAPYTDIDPEAASNISHTELTFQIGFKMKLLENVYKNSDLWFGYTQRSFWQAYNSRLSSPFRDTSYQPELMYVTPVDAMFLGMKVRFINLALMHQSNGQAGNLSRSWNRAYVQAGLERGNLSILARTWYRFHENADTDDNPDITRYMGHGDIWVNYRWRGNDFSALMRRNFSTSKGAVELGWGFPLTDKLKGFVKYFSGYGESLIDYNSYQQSVGVGFLIDF
jgi:phospholipase A1